MHSGIILINCKSDLIMSQNHKTHTHEWSTPFLEHDVIKIISATIIMFMIAPT